MHELTADNVIDYARRHGWIDPGPASAEMLGGGVSNVVFRVTTPDRRIVIKQSRPQLRTRDAWFSDLDRVYREEAVMRFLHPLLPPTTVPEVLFSNPDDYVFAMSHAPVGAAVWKPTLLSGQVDQGIGEHAGHVLARMHESTACRPEAMEAFRDHAVFVQLRVDPFYRRIQERRPEVACAVGPIIERMLGVRDAICHGDYSPKNMLVHDRGFTLVDYETAHWGDPTMDIGFFLSHLMLKAIKLDGLRNRFFDLTRAFWRGYGAEVQFQPLPELETWAIRHFGVCVLARIDGTSPVDYLAEEPKRDAARRLGRAALLEPMTQWETVLARCDEVLRG